MKRLLAVFTAAAVVLLCATPVLAAGLSISPGIVEFDVPADGSAEVEFLVYDFNGDLEISLENIPLRVEPTTVPVTAKEGGTRVVLTFYGDESLGSQVFNGKIRFLAMTGGMVAMGIKVRATVNHIATGEPLREEAPEETVPVEEAPPEEAPPEEAAPEAPEEPTAAEESPPAPPEGTPGPEETAPIEEALPEQEAAPEEAPAPAEEALPEQEAAPEEAPAPAEESPPAPPATSETTEWPIIPIAGIAAGAAIVITLIVVLARRRQY